MSGNLERPIEDYWGFQGTSNRHPGEHDLADEPVYIFSTRGCERFGVTRDSLVGIYDAAKDLPNRGSTKGAKLVAENALVRAWRDMGQDWVDGKWTATVSHIVENGFVPAAPRPAHA